MEHNYEFVMGDLEVMESVNFYVYMCISSPLYWLG